jgi:hypothetical protein
LQAIEAGIDPTPVDGIGDPRERDGGRVGGCAADDQKAGEEKVPDRPAGKGLHRVFGGHDPETIEFSAIKFARLKNFA